MSELKLNEMFNKVLEQVPKAKELIAAINHPDDIDRITIEHQVPARLYNFYLATWVSTPVGEGLHVPVQISQRSEGRPSIYFLPSGSEIVEGTVITDRAIYDCYVRRDTGDTPQARSGDTFTFRYVGLDGTEAASMPCTLKILEEKGGVAITGKFENPTMAGHSSYLCSCIVIVQ